MSRTAVPTASRIRSLTGTGAGLRGGVVLALLLLGGALGLGGCRKERTLSGMELQGLKREAIQGRQASLSAEEEFRIGSIQARTRSQFDRELEAILAGEAGTAGGGTAGGGEPAGAKVGGGRTSGAKTAPPLEKSR